jgi:hypothetical protein
LFAAFSNSEPELKLIRIIRKKEKIVFCPFISASYNNLILKTSGGTGEAGHRRLLSNSGKLPGNSRVSPPTTPTTRTFCPLFMIFPYVRDGSRGSW